MSTGMTVGTATGCPQPAGAPGSAAVGQDPAAADDAADGEAADAEGGGGVPHAATNAAIRRTAR